MTLLRLKAATLRLARGDGKTGFVEMSSTYMRAIRIPPQRPRFLRNIAGAAAGGVQKEITISDLNDPSRLLIYPMHPLTGDGAQ